MIVELFKAQSIGKTKVDNLTLRFRKPFPQHDTLEMAMVDHEQEAQTIVDHLLLTLPGGTVDQILRILLQEKASQLVVPIRTRK